MLQERIKSLERNSLVITIRFDITQMKFIEEFLTKELGKYKKA